MSLRAESMVVAGIVIGTLVNWLAHALAKAEHLQLYSQELHSNYPDLRLPSTHSHFLPGNEQQRNEGGNYSPKSDFCTSYPKWIQLSPYLSVSAIDYVKMALLS